MIGKFFVSAAYSAIYVYSSEMFPTSVRNSLLGACSMMARIGSMVAPLINALVGIIESVFLQPTGCFRLWFFFWCWLKGERNWQKLPFLVFGISGILCGISTVILPETKGLVLPKTINEAESAIEIKYSYF
jgi:OCT family organic cation transporter-like MFS transporter 4/5